MGLVNRLDNKWPLNPLVSIFSKCNEGWVVMGGGIRIELRGHVRHNEKPPAVKSDAIEWKRQMRSLEKPSKISDKIPFKFNPLTHFRPKIDQRVKF